MLLSTNGFAIAESDPSEFLIRISDQIISEIEKNKEALKTDPKIAEDLVVEHLLPVIDKQYFAKRTLGSKTWKSLTPEKQQAFVDGFINKIINKYAKGLSLYDGQDFEFEKAEISKKSGNARVKSAMQQTGEEPLEIHYHLSKKSGNWLITNIIVAGTDMRKSYKNQFIPRIKEIGIDKLIEELNAPSTAK